MVYEWCMNGKSGVGSLALVTLTNSHGEVKRTQQSCKGHADNPIHS